MPDTQETMIAMPEPAPPPELVRVQAPSPIGTLAIELTGRTLTRVVLAPPGGERKHFQPFATMDDSELLDEILGRFSEYFAGARRNLELDYDLGPSGVTGFSRRVLRETARVPYGKTRTYQQIAEAAGNPDGYRMVLSTLLVNPLPIVIPCHRVVTSKSGVGSYIAGTKRKKWLLRLEREGLQLI